jgi:acyl-coenzyme A thioesterase PaaI-like protein
VRSFRIANGLEARLRVDPRYCAFPGIVNGGVLSTIMDCHGNWTAAIALMDRSCLPKPPLTLTASMFVQFKEPTPPKEELIVRSQVVSVKESNQPGMGKVTVEVDVSVFLPAGPGPGQQQERLLVTGTGIFKKLGALRAM